MNLSWSDAVGRSSKECKRHGGTALVCQSLVLYKAHINDREKFPVAMFKRRISFRSDSRCILPRDIDAPRRSSRFQCNNISLTKKSLGC